jgi:hypothetical protein
MNFSKRTPGDLSPNPFTQALDGQDKASLLDLTESNPTKCGFHYPENLLSPLGSDSSLAYQPDAFGLLSTRKVLVDYLSSKGQLVKAENILLTASTSEAYSFLFKLLADPGDSFLVPTPGYPLLDHLTRLDSAVPIPYSLQPQPGWPLDQEGLKNSLRSDTKAIIAVNPNNPTGSFLSLQDQTFVLQLCQSRQIAYISDEVFSDYAYGPQSKSTDSSKVLTFRLGGLSKSLGLPQLKLSWVLMDGPQKVLEDCRSRLELIADTYLSVNTPVQLGLKELLDGAGVIQKEILDRVLHNRQTLERYIKDLGNKAILLPAEGGWYALLEMKNHSVTDEELAMDLMKKGVLIHPGAFYDFPTGCFLVFSLLPQEDKFEKAVRIIKDHLLTV